MPVALSKLRARPDPRIQNFNVEWCEVIDVAGRDHKVVRHCGACDQRVRDLHGPTGLTCVGAEPGGMPCLRTTNGQKAAVIACGQLRQPGA